jgi:two-component system, LytTR family, sensor histidine kinase AlgZ
MRTVASINQTGTGIRLPNFCNLGVMLRALLVANLFIGAAAVLRAPRLEAAGLEFALMAAFCEPAILATIGAACALRPLLHRVGYAASLGLLALLVGAVAAAIHWAAGGVVGEAASLSLPQVVLLAMLVAGFTLAYFDLRARALAPAIAEARIQALQSRIRPHFLYNSINAALSLIRSEPRRAEIVLEDMADLFRVLMSDNRTLAPLADEVQLTRQYLEIESLRLGERLRVSWRTETMPPDALVPPLILQPLVENAVYHGIEPNPEGGEIAIEVGMSERRLHMTLTNPMPEEKRGATGNRMAMANIRERLQLHFDAEAGLATEVKDGHWRVTIRMPYLTAPT